MSNHKIPTVLAAAALVVAALGSTSLGHAAAEAVARNSVGALQLKRGAVTNPKLAKNAVTGAKIKDGTLTAADFKAGQLPTGPQGPAGPEGPKGEVGPQGPAGQPGTSAGASANVRLGGFAVAPNAYHATAVLCLTGQRATGGGMSGTATQGVHLLDSFPTNELGAPLAHTQQPRGWKVGIHNATGISREITVYAVCVDA